MTIERPHKLRELAVWYREFAERAGNTAIWDARLRMAEDLELEAQRIEGTHGLRRDMTARSANRDQLIARSVR